MNAAAYVLSLPDRYIGNWDDQHLTVVTGKDWAHWRAIFTTTPGFESVFRSLQTKQYLIESGRYHAVERLAETDAEEASA